MSKTFRTLVTLSFAFSMLAAPLFAGQWWIPAAAHANGAQGSVWRTDVVLHNFGDTTETVTVTLLPQGADNTDLSRSTTVPVGPGATVEIHDALQQLFGFSGVAALKIDAASDNMSIRSRTFSQSSHGTFGQLVPATVSGALVQGTPAYLLGLSGTDGRRTNVGWVNASGQELTVTVKLYDAWGNELAESRFKELPYGQTQLNDVFSKLGIPAQESAYAVLTADGPFAPYASVVAAGTNDPIFVGAMTPFERAADSLIPAVVHAHGANDTNWRTDLWLLNTSLDPVTATLMLHLQNRENPSPTSIQISLDPGQQVELADVVQSYFGLDSAQGALRIMTDGGAILATSRSYTAGSTGTSGQFIPARGLNSLCASDEPFVLTGTVQDESFRTNIGLALVGQGGTVALTLRGPDGSPIATKSVSLGENEQKQISLKSLFGISTVNGGVVELVLDSENDGTLLGAYASIIDNLSGDPIYTEAAPSFAAEPDNEQIAQAIVMTTYGLSESVDNSGPRMLGSAASSVESAASSTETGCISTDHYGDSLRPGEDADGKCWQTEVTMNQCGYLFENAGWGFELDGRSRSDVCIGVDGYPSTMTSDLELTLLDLETSEQWNYRYGGEHTLVMYYVGGLPDHASLKGSSRLELPAMDGEGTDVFTLVSDLTWEGQLSSYVFIPEGVTTFTFPYETVVSDFGTAEAFFDGTPWVLVRVTLGYYQVTFKVNIFTGEVVPAY